MSAFPVLITLFCLGQMPAEEVSLKAMQARAQETQLSITNDPQANIQIVKNPVFRYSDELRGIEDAGIWIWTDRGRPVSAMKIEHYKPGVHPRPWLYCFTSLSNGLVQAEWDGNPAFRAKKPGVKWQGLDDKPAQTRAGRLVQMREIARRFNADLQRQVQGGQRDQMRLLPRPLYRYEESQSGLLDGAVFGFTGTGTNPDVLLMLDLPQDGGWQFGLAGMTAEGVTVRLNDAVVWELPHSAGRGHSFDNWVYFVPTK